MITRRAFQLGLLSSALLSSTAFPKSINLAQAGETVTPPNITFIMADDLGYGELGSYG